LYAPFDDGRTTPFAILWPLKGAQVTRLNPENPKKPIKEPLKEKGHSDPKSGSTSYNSF
jgi:hypothetical protein